MSLANAVHNSPVLSRLLSLSQHVVFFFSFSPQYLRTNTKHYHIVDKSTYNVNTVERTGQKSNKRKVRRTTVRVIGKRCKRILVVYSFVP